MCLKYFVLNLILAYVQKANSLRSVYVLVKFNINAQILSCGLLMLQLGSLPVHSKERTTRQLHGDSSKHFLLEMCRAVRQPTAAAATTIIQTSELD